MMRKAVSTSPAVLDTTILSNFAYIDRINLLAVLSEIL